VFVLERMCPLTFALLKSRRALGDLVDVFIRERNISPFRETQAPDFLDMVSAHPDRLLASVAGFERALMRVREGESGPFEVTWKVDPYVVLHRLARQQPLDESIQEGAWRVVVSPQEPGLFSIERVG
jgi:hypothetical protein